MDLFNTLGDALRTDKFNGPTGWPPTAPPYFSPEGWEFEKQQEYQKMMFMLRATRVSALIDRAGEIGMACLDAGDKEAGLRYIAIMERIIKYQINLKARYPLSVC